MMAVHMPKARRIVARKNKRLDKETLDVLTDPELMRQIRESEASFAAGERGLTFEEVFGEPLRPRRKKRR